jgi:hypothetical protein
MRKLRIWLIAAIIFIVGGVTYVNTCKEDNHKELKIAIAWREDTDNEFCTNVVEAFRQAGVNVTVLPQVKAVQHPEIPMNLKKIQDEYEKYNSMEMCCNYDNLCSLLDFVFR